MRVLFKFIIAIFPVSDTVKIELLDRAFAMNYRNFATSVAFVVAVLVSGCAAIQQKISSGGQVTVVASDAKAGGGGHKPRTEEEIKFQNTYVALQRKLNEVAFYVCAASYPPVPLEKCFDRIYRDMLGSLQPHAQYFTEEEFAEFVKASRGEYAGIGIEIGKKKTDGQLVVVHVFPGTSAEEAGVREGDLLTRIGEKPGVEFKDTESAVKEIRGKPGTQAALTFRRKGTTLDSTYVLMRRKVLVPQIRSETVLFEGKTYAIIETRQFGPGFADSLQKHVEDAFAKKGVTIDGFVISVAGNPGGLLVEAVNSLNLFVDIPAPSGVLIRDARGMRVFGADPDEKRFIVKPPGGDIAQGLPILIVANQGSASASEMWSKGMQHFGRAAVATPIEGTDQKGVVQDAILLSDQSRVKFTTSEYVVGLEKDWVPIQCVGVRPDIVIPPGAFLLKESKTAMGEDEKRVTECEQEGSVTSGGPMKDAPPHVSIKDAKPTHFKTSEHMLQAFIVRKRAEIAKRQALITE